MSNETKKQKAAIIGFGYIGSVIGTVLADRGLSVTGVEKDTRILDTVRQNKSPFNEPGLEEMIARVRANGKLEVTDDVSRAADADVFIITVGTPLAENYEPNITYIAAAAESIKPYMKDGTLVIIKSTVPPGTARNVVAPILRKTANVHIAFCPERLAEGRAIEEFLSIPVVVGGIDDPSTAAAKNFWESAMSPVGGGGVYKTITVKDAESAEMVKLACNLWIDLNIALAGELAMLSDKMNIDVLDVITAANSLPKGGGNVNILTPSVGVGGYCLTKDPWFVHSMGKKLGLDLLIPAASRNVNEKMPEYSASLIDAALCPHGGADGGRKNKKIAIMGIAFKNNTGDCRFSPVKPVIDELVRLGYQIEICDPWVMPHDAKLVTSLPVTNNIEKTLSGASCAAFLAGHREFQELSVDYIAGKVEKGALLFDGRMFWNKDTIQKMKNAGLRYKGVGR